MCDTKVTHDSRNTIEASFKCRRQTAFIRYMAAFFFKKLATNDSVPYLKGMYAIILAQEMRTGGAAQKK